MPPHKPALRFVATSHATLPEELTNSASLTVPVLVSAASPADRLRCARILHERSTRREQSFVDVQCGVPASSSTESRPVTSSLLNTSFLNARGGTIYLDDVADLDAACQTWLCSRLSAEMTTYQVRVVSGSDGSLYSYVTAGRFDRFLFYRLNVIHVHWSPSSAR